MPTTLMDHFQNQLEHLIQQHLYQEEHILQGQQQANIQISNKRFLNLCTNNYLGLANHPELIACAKQALETFGYGMASVRFISGTHSVHKALEAKMSAFLQTEDTLLFNACFDANIGLFSALCQEEDLIFSDSLNHASLIDGIRLSKAPYHLYSHQNLDDLEEKLKKAQKVRFRLIVTDGVFSMEGRTAPLKDLYQLAKRYRALLVVDDSHGTGILGDTGRGSHEAAGLVGKIDLLTGTFGKALGGAIGGYISGKKTLINWLRQKARPYLFSNSLPPAIAKTQIFALEWIEKNPQQRMKLIDNTQFLRHALEQAGFTLLPGNHPIIPLMVPTAELTKKMCAKLYELGVYVVGFTHPVVPMEAPRIRLQVSSLHDKASLKEAVEKCITVGNSLHILGV